MASRVAHLGYDQLPALLDVDEAKTLVAKSFPVRPVFSYLLWTTVTKLTMQVLDTFSNQKKRYIFWGLVSVFRTIAHILVTPAQTNLDRRRRACPSELDDARSGFRAYCQPYRHRRSAHVGPDPC